MWLNVCLSIKNLGHSVHTQSLEVRTPHLSSHISPVLSPVCQMSVPLRPTLQKPACMNQGSSCSPRSTRVLWWGSLWACLQGEGNTGSQECTLDVCTGAEGSVRVDSRLRGGSTTEMHTDGEGSGERKAVKGQKERSTGCLQGREAPQEEEG